MKIYLLRHGKVNIVNGDFFRSHLSLEGEVEVIKLMNSGVFDKPNIMFCSNFNRAVDTAKFFAENFELPLFIEKNVSEWKLQSLNHPNFPEEERKGWEDKSLVVPGGESINYVQERCVNFIKSISKEDYENILIVTHGVTAELICSYFTKRESSLETLRLSKHLDHAILEVDDGDIKVIKDIISS
jgi:2,3-bisphosphoglycerate-dependent phosphoglycerate mutase